MNESRLALLSSINVVMSFALLNDILQTIALIVAIVSGLLAIKKHFKK